MLWHDDGYKLARALEGHRLNMVSHTSTVLVVWIDTCKVETSPCGKRR